jgi:hypothetical protein
MIYKWLSWFTSRSHASNEPNCPPFPAFYFPFPFHFPLFIIYYLVKRTKEEWKSLEYFDSIILYQK